MIRVQFVHPVTRRKRELQCSSEQEAAAVRERVRHIRVLLRSGGITAGEAYRQLASRREAITLRQAAEKWAKQTTPRTQSHCATLLRAGQLSSLADEPLEALDADRLRAWIGLLSGSYADSSILAGWRILSAIVRAAVQSRRLMSLPWGDWRPPARLDPTPRPREITANPADVARLLQAARELDEQSMGECARLEALIALAVLVGLRNGELVGLRWLDVDAERRRVTIVKQGDGRRVKTRIATVRAPAELFEILGRYRVRLEARKLYAHDGPVFPAMFASRMARRPVHKRLVGLQLNDLRRAVRLAGLPNPERWTVHGLRASFVCIELASSGSLAHAMLRGRNRTLKAVQHYARGLLELEPPEPAWTLPPAPPPTSRLGS